MAVPSARLLALAMEKGKLTVVIRNPDDQKIGENPPDLSASALGDTKQRVQVQSNRRRAGMPTKLEVEKLEQQQR